MDEESGDWGEKGPWEQSVLLAFGVLFGAGIVACIVVAWMDPIGRGVLLCFLGFVVLVCAIRGVLWLANRWIAKQ